MRMKRVLSCLLLLLVSAAAKEIPEIENLASEDFAKRQHAEATIKKWAAENDTEARSELILQEYLRSRVPEEYLRLTKILLDVHFDLKRDSIPQKGAGFIGISMANPMDMQFQQRFQRQMVPGEFQQPGIAPLEPAIDLTRGAYVSAIIANTPAEKAGLMVGDLILAINGVSIAGADPVDRLMEVVKEKAPGTRIKLSIERGEGQFDVEVTLMNRKALPDNRMAGGLRVNPEDVERILEEDYLRWLREQRASLQAE